MTYDDILAQFCSDMFGKIETLQPYIYKDEVYASTGAAAIRINRNLCGSGYAVFPLPLMNNPVIHKMFDAVKVKKGNTVEFECSSLQERLRSIDNQIDNRWDVKIQDVYFSVANMQRLLNVAGVKNIQTIQMHTNDPNGMNEFTVGIIRIILNPANRTYKRKAMVLQEMEEVPA